MSRWAPMHTDWIRMDGQSNYVVRTTPNPDGTYIWIFQQVVGRAPSLEDAKTAIEAGAEYFEATGLNPYDSGYSGRR